MRRPAWIALLLAVGCAHGHVTMTSSTGPQVEPPIGTVRVTVAATLPPDRLARYRAFDGDALITDAVRSELVEAGFWAEGSDVAVEVTVETFRLRSAGAAFWVGIYAGIDMLEGTLAIGRPGEAPHTATFKYSGAEDQYMKFSAGARFRSLADVLARDVVAIVGRSRPASDTHTP